MDRRTWKMLQDCPICLYLLLTLCLYLWICADRHLPFCLFLKLTSCLSLSEISSSESLRLFWGCIFFIKVFLLTELIPRMHHHKQLCVFPLKVNLCLWNVGENLSRLWEKKQNNLYARDAPVSTKIYSWVLSSKHFTFSLAWPFFLKTFNLRGPFIFQNP